MFVTTTHTLLNSDYVDTPQPPGEEERISFLGSSFPPQVISQVDNLFVTFVMQVHFSFIAHANGRVPETLSFPLLWGHISHQMGSFSFQEALLSSSLTLNPNHLCICLQTCLRIQSFLDSKQ